jgi:hypothetical protein
VVGYFLKLYAATQLESYLVENLFNSKKEKKFKFGYRLNICGRQHKALNKKRKKGLQRVSG